VTPHRHLGFTHDLRQHENEFTEGKIGQQAEYERV
jgi:hypothetical protein